jgi:uncharacterized membrane protein
VIGGRLLLHLGAWLALAAAVHLAAVWALPRAIMWRVLQGVQAESREGVALPPMTDHEQRRIVMPSPDLLYATCAFDLRQRPLRVRADPKTPNYWSIALYAANSDNFFVLNDRDAAGRPVDLVLTSTDTPTPSLPAGARRVDAPGMRGLLLMRVLVGDYAREKAVVETARRSLRCEPM